MINHLMKLIKSNILCSFSVSKPFFFQQDSLYNSPNNHTESWYWHQRFLKIPDGTWNNTIKTGKISENKSKMA